MMAGAFGTLVFLATLWLLVVLGAAVLKESGAKIVAALKGQVGNPEPRYTARVRVRTRGSSPTRLNEGWRAAA